MFLMLIVVKDPSLLWQPWYIYMQPLSWGGAEAEGRIFLDSTARAQVFGCANRLWLSSRYVHVLAQCFKYF